MINATGNRMTREIARQSRLAQGIAQTQIQVSTGKRIQRASDDPVAAARVATLRTAQANDTAWAANIGIATDLTAQADAALKTVSGLLGRARELTVAGASEALSAADRISIATELGALADEIDAISITRSSLSTPLFATASPLAIRFDSDSAFAPVPARAALFDSNGLPPAQHIRDAATAIQSGNGAAIANSLDRLDGAIDQLATAQAQIGVNAARLERMQEMQAGRSIDRSAERSALEDTDLSSAIAQLNAQTITLEAAQAAFARINRRNLFDILG